MIVLLFAPFLRFVGSHNDRLPLECCYASTELERRGIEHVVINADATGSDVYIPWSELFHNFPYFMDGIDGRSPIYSEVLERVMSYEPELVVIAAGDALAPDVDCGHYQIGINFSNRLRRRGIKTIGVGKFYAAYPKRFAPYFDGITSGPCIVGLAEAIRSVLRGNKSIFATRADVDILPSFEHVIPQNLEDSWVFTNFGCPYKCRFCYRPRIYRGQYLLIRPELFAEDVARRKCQSLVIRDGTIATEPRRIEQLAEALERKGVRKTFACDIRADLASPEMLQALKRMGVERLKVGLEILDDEALRRLNKLEDARTIRQGLERIKRYGFQLTVCLIAGACRASREAWERTIKFIEELEPDSIVINTAAYLDFDDPRAKYDAHFSPISAKRHGVDEDILWRLLKLQDKLKNPSIKVTE